MADEIIKTALLDRHMKKYLTGVIQTCQLEMPFGTTLWKRMVEIP
jgi:hypothetical protein